MKKIRLTPGMTKPTPTSNSCINPKTIPNDDATIDPRVPAYTKNGTTTYTYTVIERDPETHQPIIDPLTGKPKLKEINSYRVDKKWDDWEDKYVKYKIYFRLNICAASPTPPKPQIIIPPLGKPPFCFDAVNKRKC